MRTVLRGGRAACLALVLIVAPGALAACTHYPARYGTVAEGDRTARGDFYTVRVKRGETVNSIARDHKTAPNRLMEFNGLRKGDRIYPGLELRVPYRSTIRSAYPVHRVRRDETLYGISRKYGTDPKALARLNRIRPPYIIRPGEEIRLPAGSTRTTRVARAAPEPRYDDSFEGGWLEPPDWKDTYRDRYDDWGADGDDGSRGTGWRAARADGYGLFNPPKPRPAPRGDYRRRFGNDGEYRQVRTPRFRWPVQGPIISTFGSKGWGHRNDGVNIAVPRGTPVRAADHGVVIYHGNEIPSFGNLLLIRHSDGLVTAYAHNERLRVTKGDYVRRGEVIALAGQTGNVSRPQLHFEVRRGTKAVDPRAYLPPLSSRTARRASFQNGKARL